MKNGSEKKVGKVALRRRIAKLPKWLDMEDICFLSGATAAEMRIVADQILDGAETHPDIFINATVVGKFPVFRTSLASKHFDLNARGFLRKLDTCDWYEIINTVCAKEYNYVLASVGSVNCAHKIKNRKMMSEWHKLQIQNSESEKDLLPADEVEKHFAAYTNEVIRILDDLVTTIPIKIEGAKADEIERVLKEYGARSRSRLNSLAFDHNE